MSYNIKRILVYGFITCFLAVGFYADNMYAQRGDYPSMRAQEAFKGLVDFDGNIIVYPHGSMYISSAASVANTSGTEVKANGTTTAVILTSFDMPANNRLRYIGPSTINVHCSAALSAVTDAGGNITLEFFFAKGGAVDAKTHISRKLTIGTDEGAASLDGVFSLAQNEYIEVFVDSIASDPAITLSHLYITCQSIGPS